VHVPKLRMKRSQQEGNAQKPCEANLNRVRPTPASAVRHRHSLIVPTLAPSLTHTRPSAMRAIRADGPSGIEASTKGLRASAFQREFARSSRLGRTASLVA
jgi:hypothetical protein